MHLIVNLQTVRKLGLRVRKLCRSMRLKQVDGSIIGGLPTSYLTKPVHLTLGTHQETNQFVVAPKMAEAMILGLAWLSQWKPIVHWGKGERCVAITGKEKKPPPKKPGQAQPAE